MVSTFRRNSALNLLFNYSNVIFNLVTGVFLVPFYLHNIPLDVYGSFLIATGIAALIGLLEFGLSMVITQRLAQSYAEANWTHFRRTAFAGIVAATLLFALSVATTAITALFINWLTKIDKAFAEDLCIAFLLVGIAGCLNIYLNLFGAMFQALLRAGTLGAINLAAATVGIAVVVTVFPNYPSLAAIAIGFLVRATVASSMLAFCAFLQLKRQGLLPMRAPLAETFRILRSSGPVFLSTVSKSLAENAQNLLLASATSPSSIAVLALTQKAFQVCTLILAPIGSSIYANLTQIKAKSEPAYFASLLGASIRAQFLFSILLIATAACFNQSFVTLWVGAEKFGGAILTVLLAISVLITSRFSFFSFLIYSTGEFKKPVMLDLGFSITKVALIFCLVKHLGLVAIPVAEIAAGFIFLFLMSTHLMVGQLKGSNFIAGIYYRGWPEFAAVLSLGVFILKEWPLSTNWLSLMLATPSYMISACALIVVCNLSFIKQLTLFFRRKL